MSLLRVSLIVVTIIGLSAFLSLLIADEPSDNQGKQLPLEIKRDQEKDDPNEPSNRASLETEEANHGRDQNPRYTHNYGAPFLCVARWLWKYFPRAQVATNWLLVFVTFGLGVIAWKQYTFGQVSERAYVVFGSKNGGLADFGSATADNKEIIKLHFFNAGQSVARHFAVQVHTCAAGGTFMFTQRHRTKGPLGDMTTNSAADELDLGGQAEHTVYVIDPKQLWTVDQLRQPGCFWIQGQIEYCDIFGTYHCENFGAEWAPVVGDFVPHIFLQCLRQPIDPRGLEDWRMGNHELRTEIEPCEQPDEPEYNREPTP
jgi:hypothetical protein